MSYQDPGWRRLGSVFIPKVGPFLTRGTRVDALTVLRLLFVAFVAGLWGFLLVLTLVLSDRDPAVEPPNAWFGAGLALYGVVALTLTRWARARPLDTTSAQVLAGSYRNNFLLGMTLSESIALAGIVCAFITNRLWMYLVGLGVSMIGFAMMAPTRGNIELKQQEIIAQGSSLSLGDALMLAPPPDSG